jgi:hypothetical protein
MAWKVATEGKHKLPRRTVQAGALDGVPKDVSGLAAAAPETEAARSAIMACVDHACHEALGDALAVQAKHSAEFMVSPACRHGAVGADYTKTMAV